MLVSLFVCAFLELWIEVLLFFETFAKKLINDTLVFFVAVTRYIIKTVVRNPAMAEGGVKLRVT